MVHDGVLQALAYIHRRGAELGPDGEELASLAGDQERTLRRFVSGTGAPAVGPTDLRGDPDVDTDVDYERVVARSRIVVDTRNATQHVRKGCKNIVKA